ncbi:MAG TPA: alanine racemase [Tepidisphaeraceae bacterium]|jgi:alanine racemase
MSPSRHVRVVVDLNRVRQNAERIGGETRVPVIAVIKADAYGLGSAQVASALADVVDRFAVFSPEEARTIELWNRTGKEAIAIGRPAWNDPADYIAQHVRPAVSNAEQARQLQSAHPLLCVDTGQQRFACPVEQVDEVLRAGGIDEAFTHASRLDQVEQLKAAVGGRVARLHAAGSSLLHEPAARLDAVRPGLALYRGAARVSSRLIEVHKSAGPAGYGGFVTPFHGVILAGYSHGLRPGPCLVGGRLSRILEVGMQSAFIETDGTDRAGDEVVLLGDTLDEDEVAQAWNVGPHECLVRLASAGIREYVGA